MIAENGRFPAKTGVLESLYMFLKFTVQWLLNSFIFFLLKGLAIKQDYSRQGQEKKEERKVLSGSVKCRSVLCLSQVL